METNIDKKAAGCKKKARVRFLFPLRRDRFLYSAYFPTVGEHAVGGVFP
jgi:hypothetical protein